MLDKLESVEKRFEEINALLCIGDTASDINKYTALMKEMKQLEPVVEKFREYKTAEAAIKEAREMLEDGTLDKELRELAKDEFEQAKANAEKYSEELKTPTTTEMLSSK